MDTTLAMTDGRRNLLVEEGNAAGEGGDGSGFNKIEGEQGLAEGL